MEPRFGHDFSQVRVHTDARAAESARAVNALAYTVGRDVVFGTGQYMPGTMEGKRLMAHELTHVVQQGGSVGVLEKLSHPSDPLEKAADATADMVINGGNVATAERALVQSKTSTPTIFRKVATGLVRCTAGVDGVPADPAGVLTSADNMAESFATRVSFLLALDSGFVRGGFRDPKSETQKAYRTRFGLPPARSGGFLNRLTGVVRPTQDIAISEELQILSRRFEIIARTFREILHYRCVGVGSGFGGCNPKSCAHVLAWSCEGVDAIFLCPSFWTHGTKEQAAILIHESGHINWGRVGDNMLRGPGANFRIADCYASFVAASVGTTNPADTCPQAGGEMGDFPIPTGPNRVA